jgi:metal-responsive CopG/Arc/MetJ family transcriptional regulator
LTISITIVILISMKTAISIPDPLFKEADNTAHEMGIPRSQLYSLAIQEYVSRHSRKLITQKLNDLYKNIETENESNKEVGIESLRKATENDSW